MTILLSTQSDLTDSRGLGGILFETARDIGIDGFPGPGTVSKARGNIESFRKDAAEILSNAIGGSLREAGEPSFVHSGKKTVVGTNVPAGEGYIPPLESASNRTVYSQQPVASVLIKKRAFSSLNHLYDPVLMDDSEKWLFRATKRLFMNKCAQMRDYEMLTKIKKLADLGSEARTALLSFITNFGAQIKEIDSQFYGGGTAGASDVERVSGRSYDSGSNWFTSAMRLERLARAKEPVDFTTWFFEPDLPVVPELGLGSGVFETALVTSASTSLSLDGSGTCSLSLQNPYNIMMITESDIEDALRQSALSPLTAGIGSAASRALSSAQRSDGFLQESRRKRGTSAITFTVNIGGGSGVKAVIDAIGYEIFSQDGEDNFDTIPDGHDMTDNEQAWFKDVYRNLGVYSSSVANNIIKGNPASSRKGKYKEEMKYARRMLRRFYLGRYVIQPMDQISVFIDGGTRRPGEGNSIGDDESSEKADWRFYTELGGGALADVFGLKEGHHVDDRLLLEAYKRSGQHLKFHDFKRLAVSGGGMHVFGGLVMSADGSFNAESGTHTLSISAGSNMEWLKISTYNKKPSLKQTDGIVYDPLTPFTFKTDPASGLPIGRPELTDVNKEILAKATSVVTGGANAGKLIASSRAPEEFKDVVDIGGALVPLYDMPPGLKYKWKEGIVTTTYDMSTVDPLDKSKTNERQLRRDIGQFASNMPFQNMDVANIISSLVTGFPYNPATFLTSAFNTGTFSTDTTFNSGLDYFHSTLDYQKSLNLTHGNWAPFKMLSTNPGQLARAYELQLRLTKQSSEIQTLQTQLAEVGDSILNSDASRTSPIGDKNPARGDLLRSQKALNEKKASLESKLRTALQKFDEDFTTAKQKHDVLGVSMAGNDVTFDLRGAKDSEDYAFLGDELIFLSQRRRENVMFNRDKNYLIVSDEYDKDFDIQAFNLQLSGASFNMWRSNWRPVYELCRQAAEIIDFEFFINTQGHLELRPPQYNRTPVSVFTAMMTFARTTGIKLFPDFLEKLVLSRTESLLRDIKVLEYKMQREMAILNDPENATAEKLGIKWFVKDGEDLPKAMAEQEPLEEKQRSRILETVRKLGAEAQTIASQQFGLFSSRSQVNLMRSLKDSPFTIASEEMYNQAVESLVVLTGNPRRIYGEFEDVKVGAAKNGKSTPSSDRAAAIGRLSSFVSRRARLLRKLDSHLGQAEEILEVNEGGGTSLITGGRWGRHMHGNAGRKNDLFDKLVVDDAANILGHMSGRRFVIEDDVIKESSFKESQPGFTHVSVQGTEPLIGERLGGASAGVPIFLAIGVDFDMWRQYGFRSEKPFEKPFLWNAEQQCAPYAKMLLSRQRRNIVTGNIKVIGNEFYQLGDVVYVADRQLLYYVNRISHNFVYEGDFSTSLELNYGHPPGEYIPTPTDIMGKSLSNKYDKQASYRTRRFGPGMGPSQDMVLGAVLFSESGSDSTKLDLLRSGSGHGRRNYDVLVRALATMRSEAVSDDKSRNPRLLILSFGDNSDKSSQESRMKKVSDWFLNPESGAQASDMSVPSSAMSAGGKFGGIKQLDPAKVEIRTKFVPQLLPVGQLSSTDLNLLREGSTASPDAHALDPTLKNVIEIRLRRPPPGGWTEQD